MKKTIGEWEFLRSALDQLLSYDLPGPLALRAAMIQDSISQKLSAFEKKKEELFREHGREGGQPGTLVIPPENLSAFQQAIEPLVKIEVEIAVEKIPREEISAARMVKGISIKNIFPLIQISNST